MEKNPKRTAIYEIFWGLVLTVAAAAFWYSIVGNPIEELWLLQTGAEAKIEIGECFDDVVEDDQGHGGIVERCPFSYQVNSQVYYGRGDNISDSEVIYLPSAPSVHRLKSLLATGYADWFFRKILLGLVLLVIFLSAGVGLFYTALKNLCQLRRVANLNLTLL